MALLIDTPRWPWHGHLWAHMISDESLDELHAAARDLGLRWLSFGRDHYDVPEPLWPAACEVAELVDSREIVRSLRRTGLRVPGGKPQKAWRWVPALPAEMRTAPVDDWLRAVDALLDDPDVDVLHRPGEHVVLHLVPEHRAPRLGPLAEAPSSGTQVIETVVDGRWSVELVLPHGPK